MYCPNDFSWPFNLTLPSSAQGDSGAGLIMKVESNDQASKSDRHYLAAVVSIGWIPAGPIYGKGRGRMPRVFHPFYAFSDLWDSKGGFNYAFFSEMVREQKNLVVHYSEEHPPPALKDFEPWHAYFFGLHAYTAGVLISYKIMWVHHVISKM